MNRVIVLFIFISVLVTCKKKDKGGIMIFKMQYTTKSSLLLKAKSDSLYTCYGNYITSLTPYHFSGKFKMLGFQDGYNLMDGNTHSINYIDGNNSPNDPLRVADFSNDAVVSYSPGLNGIQDDHGLFNGEFITFIYFYFDLNYLYQEVVLPAQYDTITLDMFNRSYGNHNFTYYSDSVKKNGILRVDYYPFLSKVFNNDNYWPSAYLFGNCDSTFIFNLSNEWIPTSENNLFVGGTNQPIVRINKYNVVTI